MKIEIKLRKLSITEIAQLIDDINKFPHLGFIGEESWNSFFDTYTVYLAGKFAGVCVVIQLRNWAKIGPIIVLEKYQGQGLGRKLLGFVVKQLNNKNIYIGSSNPKIQSIVMDLEFRQMKCFWLLPKEIKIYLIKYFFQRLNWKFVKDAVKKRIILEHRNYGYFVKYKQTHLDPLWRGSLKN